MESKKHEGTRSMRGERKRERSGRDGKGETRGREDKVDGKKMKKKGEGKEQKSQSRTLKQGTAHHRGSVPSICSKIFGSVRTYLQTSQRPRMRSNGSEHM